MNRSSIVAKFVIPAAALALAALVYGATASAAGAAISAGDLIKLPDDRDPRTTDDAAVYYYGADHKRYVFPNSQDYFTWYPDFSGVKIVDAATMASIPLGGNVTYRPGTRLVKITTDPHVYAVEPGGVLRWVQTEAVASSLYGADWNKRIDDIPDAFFLNYTIGAPLAAAVYPDGSIVKRSSDGALFRIENRTKRRLTLADPKTVFRLQDKFILTAPGDLSDYPDGADISGAEPAVGDTSQKNLTGATDTPTFSVRLPATDYIPVGGEGTLLELHIVSAKAVNVSRLAVRLDATTGVPQAGVLDDDNGGLVYGNNAQPNFRLLRWVDARGNAPFGGKEIAVDVNQDQSQTFNFTGSFQVPAGTDQVLYLRAQVNPLLPSGEGYQATWLAAGAAVNDAAGGATLIFAPSTDIAGAVLSTLNSSLEVHPASTSQTNTYVRGAKDVVIAGLNFKATTFAPNVIKSLRLQGFVNAENSNVFVPGTDSYGGASTAVRDLVAALNLYDSQGHKLAGPSTVDLNGIAAFTGLSFGIPAGQSADLIVRGDLSSTVDLKDFAKKVTFDVADASTDVAVVDDKGAKVNASGLLPNGGTQPVFFTTVKDEGKVRFNWNVSGGTVLAGQEVLLGALDVATTDDAYALSTVTFVQSGGIAGSIGDLRLEYPVAGGATVSVSQSFLGNSVTFNNLPVVCDKDKTTELKLYTRVLPRNGGAVYGEHLRVQFAPAAALNFTSRTNGQQYSESDLGPTDSSDFYVSGNAVSDAVVRYSRLTVVKAAAQPGNSGHDSDTETLRFSLQADPGGTVRIKKLTFKISPGDPNQDGPNNDSLELWAKMNGDAANDFAMADLYQVVGNSQNRIGEDGSATVSFSVFHNGTQNTTPIASNYVSSGGDYGWLVYTFKDGSELSVGPGGLLDYVFDLDTGAFASNQDYSLGVELEGGSDLLWTDIPSGAYTALTGNDAAGVPVGNSITVTK